MLNRKKRSRSIAGGIVFAAFAVLAQGCADGNAGSHRLTDVKAMLGPPYIEVTQAVTPGQLMPLPKLTAPGAAAELPGAKLPAGLWVRDAQGVDHRAADRTLATGDSTWRTQIAGYFLADLVLEESGDLSIEREVELAEDRRVEYDPPLAMLPAELKMGPPAKRVSQVNLYQHRRGVLEASGTCTAEYRLLGAKEIEVSGRRVRAVIVLTERRFDLPLVVVRMRVLSGYEPGEGLVAAATRRDLWLLGVLPIRLEESVVRAR